MFDDLMQALDSADTSTETAQAPPATGAPTSSAATETPEGAQPEGEQQPSRAPEGRQQPPEGGQEDPFSEQALSTPAGIKRAQDVLAEERRKVSQNFVRLRKREQAAKVAASELGQERQALAALNQRLTSDLSTLQQGDPRAFIETIGRLSGRDGTKLFEAISLALATGGKAPKQSPEYQELKRNFEELQAKIARSEEEREQRARQQQVKAFVEQRKAQLLQQGSDDKLYPAVSHFVTKLGRQKEVAEYLLDLKLEAHDQGLELSDSDALAQLEGFLKPHLPPSGSGGTGSPHSAQPRKPESGGLPGQSLAPSLTTQSTASKRAMTDEEHRQALMQDKDFWTSLGLD